MNEQEFIDYLLEIMEREYSDNDCEEYFTYPEKMGISGSHDENAETIIHKVTKELEERRNDLRLNK